ncbi:MAG: sensor histidine kinase [Nitrososphaeraceae archaeon]
MLIAISATAIVFSMLAYQYSNSISTKVVDIATQEIRSNAIIQAHDLSEILTNRIESIIPLLQTLTDSPAVQNNEYQRARLIIDFRQNYTSGLTDFYMWLDKDGKIVWISNINSTAYQQYKGFDLSYRPYFTMAKNSSMEYYSSAIESNDRVPRFFLSYPILSKQGGEYRNVNATEKGSFMGVVVAGIRTGILGELLKNQLLPQFNSTIGLLDKNGLVLYADNQSFVGKNIFGKEIQSALSTLLSAKSRDQLNEALKNSVNSDGGGSSSIDVISKQGTINTIAFAPVLLNGTNFLTLYVAVPHNLAGEVASAISEQKYLSILIIVIIGSVASIIAYITLTWNKRLRAIVNSRTSDLDKANKELTSAYEQLKIHHKTQKEFIDIAAHELRTPLQPIIGIMNVLRSRVTDYEQQKLFDIVIRNAKRLQRLSEDILDVTRIEGHTLDIKKEVFDINNAVTSILQEYRSQTDRNNNKKYNQFPEISFQPEKASVYVQADKGRITQVINNLVDNAIKFAPQQNGKLDIVVSYSDSDNKEKFDGNVIVSVKDNGTGIDPEIMPKLFSKFATKSFSGTGLGLYVSKNIIEAHGGKIWAENNNNGNGATFYFSLPISGPINISYNEMGDRNYI